MADRGGTGGRRKRRKGRRRKKKKRRKKEVVTDVFGHSSHAFVLPSPPICP